MLLLIFAAITLGGLGTAFGALIGWITYRLCRSIEAASVEILLTLASVVGGYVLAASLGLSGPLAMVVAGLVMSAGKERAFGEHTRERIEGFWETLDEVLNILLFAFIGLDVLLTPTAVGEVLAGLLMIVVALVARFVSVALPMTLVRRRDGYGPWTIRVLTWGGLRGGIAISLALGLPASPYRSALVTATYVVVLFTIAVQGLTVMPIVRRAAAAEAAAEAAAGETENRAARP